MPTIALIVAGGRGERLGAELPKQYRPLAHMPMLRRSVACFLAHSEVAAVRVVIDPAHRALYDSALLGLDLLAPVAGGSDRQESARLGLESLVPLEPARVLIHDAARPLVSADLIGRVIAALAEHPAVLPAIPVVDTLKRVEGETVAGEVARAGLVRAQTPQGFAFRAILEAHRAAQGRGLTDDSAVAAAAGLPVHWITGEESNVKVTHRYDLDLAERYLATARTGGRGRAFRTGFGYDVHRLVEGRPLVLGGVAIPFEKGLLGHSDADVALHALTDAILGIIAAGDIGVHFPPSDPRWKDASSDRFLAHAMRLLAEAGGRLEHVDLTILAERPKIGPHRAAMQARLAGLLGLPEDRISIKATTTEGLGYTGRGEGIVAQAVATAAFEVDASCEESP